MLCISCREIRCSEDRAGEQTLHCLYILASGTYQSITLIAVLSFTWLYMALHGFLPMCVNVQISLLLRHQSLDQEPC